MEPRNCRFTNSAHSYYQIKVKAQSVVVGTILSAKSRPFTRMSLGLAGIWRGAHHSLRRRPFTQCSVALLGWSASAATRRLYPPSFSSLASTLGFSGPFHRGRDVCRHSRHALPDPATALFAGSDLPPAARCFLLDALQYGLAVPSCSCARSPLP